MTRLWALSVASVASAGVVWLISLPGAVTAQVLDPHFVDINQWIQDVVVPLLVAWSLAGVVWRSRQLVIRQVTTTRERANLARYFPPNVVDGLANLDEPFGAVRSQPAAHFAH